ncbi:MAG: glycosyltransferase family 2 protein [Planctomycetota bacterium]
MQGKKILAVAPCFNEETRIGQVIQRVQGLPAGVVDELVIVDDGSSDNSPKVARELGATVLRLDTMQGVGAALRKGFDYALEKGFDIIVVLAGNNKDEPQEIPDLLAPILSGESDFVQGSRFLKRQSLASMPFYRRVATRLHPLLFSFCSGKRVTESTNGFRAFRRELLEDPRIRLHQKWLDEYELEPYLYYQAIRLGYRTGEVGCTKIYPPRGESYTKMQPITGWWSILRPLFLLRLGLRR